MADRLGGKHGRPAVLGPLELSGTVILGDRDSIFAQGLYFTGDNTAAEM